MLKRIIYAGLISLSLVSASYANDFYIGAGIGHQTATIDKKLSITTPDNSYRYYKHDHQPSTGTLGNIFTGYEWNFDRFYLATELNASLSSLKYHGYFTETEDGINNTSEATYTLRNSYGLSLLPGYQVSDNVLLYGRIGYVKGNFKYAEYKTNTGEGERGVTEHEWLNGIRYGLGINTSLSKNIALRLEYDQTRYGTYKDSTFPMPSGQFRQIDLTPFVNQAELDLVYKFS